ncbi:type II toxin-antitoxin system VapC family toxin [Nesterenkonia muleiensis]|uniref:type II toxin-antitoxin system VapC family toxin n=1 Tax=Nesterenkonia muleiensis TaxID=2282648 RepID=UPI000E716B77|nr:type II toxin-antitoxin system VapC family toxin [Nesterenkonia muleiensis]
MTVLDASAVLAFLKEEPGREVVEEALGGDTHISAVNWSETAQKVSAAGGDWAMARAVLKSFGLYIESVTEADAERAAELWEPGGGLSLADRLCLAVGERLDATILTADRAWGSSGNVRQIR